MNDYLDLLQDEEHLGWKGPHAHRLDENGVDSLVRLETASSGIQAEHQAKETGTVSWEPSLYFQGHSCLASLCPA